MKVVKVEALSILKRTRKYSKDLKRVLDELSKSDFECVKLIDDEGCYYNTNDLRRAAGHLIKTEHYDFEAFLCQGEVYIRRK